MSYRTFIAYNVIGGVIWGAGVVGLGAMLGEIAFVRNNIEAIFLGLVALSVVPGIFGIVKSWTSKRKSAK